MAREPNEEETKEQRRRALRQIETRISKLQRELHEARQLRDRLRASDRHPRADAIAWLQRVLADGPVKARVLHSAAREVGHSEKTLRRAANAMGVLRDPPNGGRECVWKLPTNGTEREERADQADG